MKKYEELYEHSLSARTHVDNVTNHT